MSETGIEVSDVSKKFRRGELHDSLRDLIPYVTGRMFRRSATALETTDFWAVRDISFTVKPGDTLGIIGPNGAGKSTLLKLLTKILRPTVGRIVVRGRIGALIELAAGFHPDLTGRENIYLQGAIMGMTRMEIEERFDQIVEFSGIPDFIETPIKRYSSGMNARLGFSIAAHLHPEVLIIDEVLAVGDFQFQTKAFGRIRHLARESGIPVVVVSHQLDRIAELCTQAVLLNKGRVAEFGTPDACIAAYLFSDANVTDQNDPDAPIIIEAMSVESPRPARSGAAASFRMRGRVVDPERAENCDLVLTVRALHTGEVAFSTDVAQYGVEVPRHGAFEMEVELDMNVQPALYSIELVVRDHKSRKRYQGPPLSLQVVEGKKFRGRVQMNARMRLEQEAVAER